MNYTIELAKIKDISLILKLYLDRMKYLRLDCLRFNEKLNEIYEEHGFKLVRYGKNERYSYSLRELKIDE